jgi:hypothetical protein
MPFRCPECLSTSLEIARTIELPPDSRSDEITLQVMECSGCGFRALAVYEESRRGALDSEAWEHCGYQASPASLQSIAAAIEACPAPRDPHCPCPSHRILGRRDALGRWQGLEGSGTLRPFPLELV